MSNKVRWGCIGCGGIADKRTLPGMMLSDKCELVAVMDVNAEVAEKIRAKYHAKYAFTDYRELLALPEIDAVYIASPVFCHKEQTMAAADAGKPVLLEKPMTVFSDEAQEIADYCAQKGVMLGVGFMMRFSAAHQAMKQYVESGKLGQIVSMNGRLDCYFPAKEGNWRQAYATGGGGSMTDMGIHCIDVMQYITGLKTEEVTGFCCHQHCIYEVEDGATAVLRMNNQALMTVQANFNVGSSLTTMEIHGTEGSLYAEETIGQLEGGKVRFVAKDGTRTEVALDHGNMYTKELEAFGEALQAGKPAPVTAEQAITNQRIVEAIYRSDREGKRVTV